MIWRSIVLAVRVKVIIGAKYENRDDAALVVHLDIYTPF